MSFNDDLKTEIEVAVAQLNSVLEKISRAGFIAQFSEYDVTEVGDLAWRKIISISVFVPERKIFEE